MVCAFCGKEAVGVVDIKDVMRNVNVCQDCLDLFGFSAKPPKLENMSIERRIVLAGRFQMLKTGLKLYAGIYPRMRPIANLVDAYWNTNLSAEEQEKALSDCLTEMLK